MRASAAAIAIVIAIEKTGNQRLKCEIKCKRLSVEIKCFPKAGGMRASASAIAIVIAIEKTGNQRLKCEIKCKRRSVETKCEIKCSFRGRNRTRDRKNIQCPISDTQVRCPRNGGYFLLPTGGFYDYDYDKL